MRSHVKSQIGAPERASVLDTLSATYATLDANKIFRGDVKDKKYDDNYELLITKYKVCYNKCLCTLRKI